MHSDAQSGLQSKGRSGRRRRDKSPADAGTLPVEEQLDKAREVALRMLTATARTRGQLADGLARKGYDEHVVETLLERFEEVGLIDDADYADRLVRTRRDERGLSRRAIAAELSRKGVDSEVSRQALAQYDDEDETAAATREAAVRLRRTVGLHDDVRRRRAFAALARKGYGADVARQAVEHALEALDQGASG